MNGAGFLLTHQLERCERSAATGGWNTDNTVKLNGSLLQLPSPLFDIFNLTWFALTSVEDAFLGQS